MAASYPLPADVDHDAVPVTHIVDDLARRFISYGLPNVTGSDYIRLQDLVETFLFGTSRNAPDVYADLAALAPLGLTGDDHDRPR